MTGDGKCACGCGQPTRIASKTNRRCGDVARQPRRWVDHHYRQPPPQSAMPGADLRALRHAHGWTTTEVARALGCCGTLVVMMELGYRPVSAAVAEWAQRVPALPAGQAPRFTPDAAGLCAWMAARRLTRGQAAYILRVTTPTIHRWRTGENAVAPRVRVWLALGALRDWRPPPPPGLDREPYAELPRIIPEQPTSGKPGPDWVWLPRQGWAPPAAYCNQGTDFDRLPGCWRCAYRSDCAGLQVGVPA